MCIVLLSTAHPKYPFILLSNRDEFISRPTAAANWWDAPNQHVLGGRDLQRKECGTWLAVTKQGRIAALTNFREEGDQYKAMGKSRGGIVNAYLTGEIGERPQEFATRLIEEVGVRDVGGFSLLFGELRAPSPSSGAFPGLSIISNRSATAEDLTSIATKPGETHGLSNSHFGDTSWPKVVLGEGLLQECISLDVDRPANEKEFIESLFNILSVDKLPKRRQDEDWDAYVYHMRESILIPPTGIDNTTADKVATAQTLQDRQTGKPGYDTPDHGKVEVRPEAGGYGTQKQTVILVDQSGKVRYVERTLYNEHGVAMPKADQDRVYMFAIDGWSQSGATIKKTEVYAQGYGDGLAVIFRFKQNRSAGLASLAHRIVNRYFDDTHVHGFESREAMCGALWAAVRAAWKEVKQNEALKDPAAVVDIDCHEDGQVSSEVAKHPDYAQFAAYLKAGDELGHDWLSKVSVFESFENLIPYEEMSGKGSAMKCQQRNGGAEYFVFKGIDFRIFLREHDGQYEGTLMYLIRKWHQSNNTLSSMPPHPNILPPPSIAVTLPSGSGNERVVCGCLCPYYANGNLGARIGKVDEHEEIIRLPLQLRKKWCHQIVEVAYHTHRVAHTYHMDIKPDNFLLTDSEDLVLIGWEQFDAPTITLAPEADGTSHVETVPCSYDRAGKLVYTKYTGQERNKMDESAPTSSWNIWNVLYIWSKEHPRALELAEVFSVGMTMWMILRQPDSDRWDEGVLDNELIDWDRAGDVPGAWTDTVEQCIDDDANGRHDLACLREITAGRTSSCNGSCYSRTVL